MHDRSASLRFSASYLASFIGIIRSSTVSWGCGATKKGDFATEFFHRPSNFWVGFISCRRSHGIHQAENRFVTLGIETAKDFSAYPGGLDRRSK